MTNQPSIKKNIALNTIVQVLNIILPFITAPYVSRVLGAEGIGTYSYTSSLSAYFAMFAALGTGVYGAREIARVREDEKVYSKIFWEIELLSILTSIIALASWFIFSLLYKEYTPILLILSLTILGNLFDVSWFFTGLEQFKFLVTRNIFFKVLGVVLIFIFVKHPSDLTLYIFLLTVTNFIGIVSIWMVLPKFLVKVNVHTLDIKPHFSQTLIYFIPTIATSIYNVLDKTMIGLFTTSMAENGYYDQANKIITPLKTIAFAALNGVLTARISYLFAKKDYNKIKELIDNSLEFILFMGIGIFFGLVGVSKNFVPLFFGQGYDGVVPILMLMSPVVTIIGISNCLGAQYYTPSGRRKQSSKYIISGSVLNLMMNLVLIPKFGAVGATISTIVAEALISFLYVRNSNGYVTFKTIYQKGVKKFLAGLLMFVGIWEVESVLEQSAISLVVQIMIGGLIYIGALLLFRDRGMQTIKNRFLKN